MDSGKLIIFSAPSGAGKTTIVRHLLAKFPNLSFSISATTRPIRGTEVNGHDYYFISKEEFLHKVAKHEFAEFEEVYAGTYYGTLGKEIQRIWSEGKQVIFDLETTGLQITKDRIVQIAILKVFPDGTTEEFSRLVNPEMVIVDESTAIHGVSNEMVKNESTFAQLAPEILDFIGVSDLAGYNSNKFDIPVLSEELLRTGNNFDLSNRRFVDVQNIFHKMEQRTLSAAYQFYCCLLYTSDAADE